MKITDIAPEVLERIKKLRYDRILEKHEGPENWNTVLKHYNPEFLMVDGQPVLLPVPGKRIANITVLRVIVGDQGNSLTLFFKDTTYLDDPDDDTFAGFIAICDKFPGTQFFVAIVYHEWYLSAPVRAS
jgi:hypothetical protein